MTKNNTLLIVTSGIMAVSIMGWWLSSYVAPGGVAQEESSLPEGIPMTAERQRVIEELTNPYVLPTPEDRARIRAELGL